MVCLVEYQFINTLFYTNYSGNVLASEVEEARMLVDTAERAKKNADNEVSIHLRKLHVFHLVFCVDPFN